MTAPTSPKQIEYNCLVSQRKACTLCQGLTNPSCCLGGAFDSEHIGPWTAWQGNLDADLMVVGQDWGTLDEFRDRKGQTRALRTDRTLIELLASVGVRVDPPEVRVQHQVAFFTNAILCLKAGGMQSSVPRVCFTNCSAFLRRQVEIVQPRVVVTLGAEPFGALCRSFGIRTRSFRSAVEDPHGFCLSDRSVLFPVYHCGARVLNTVRPLPQQFKDWERIGHALKANPLHAA